MLFPRYLEFLANNLVSYIFRFGFSRCFRKGMTLDEAFFIRLRGLQQHCTRLPSIYHSFVSLSISLNLYLIKHDNSVGQLCAQVLKCRLWFQTLCPIVLTTVIGFMVERRCPHNAISQPQRRAQLAAWWMVDNSFFHRWTFLLPFCFAVLLSWIYRAAGGKGPWLNSWMSSSYFRPHHGNGPQVARCRLSL